ncbi:MAG: glycosyltransferase family 4 protein [Bacteroidia bacterium]
MSGTVKKILLSVPAETATGGIKNYFRALKSRFTLPVEYIERGSKTWPYRKDTYTEIKRFIGDILEFRKKIRTGDYEIVQTSTSLGIYSVIRDGIFLKIAHANRVKTIVFFRGWDKAVEAKIERSYLNSFRRVFFKADLFIVLSPEFREVLQRWGYKKNILLETTLIDSDLISSFDLEKIMQPRIRKDEGHINLLFLARTEIEKGIYETINTYSIVKRANPDITVSLTIAGNGIEFERMKSYAQKVAPEGIIFLGNIDGEQKIQAFLDADIYIFPSYSEGMPNSVLEAMAFGLPVIGSSAGAIPYIVKEGVNGYLTNSSDPTVLASLVQRLINSKALRLEMAKENFTKAKDEFYSDKVITRIEKIYKQLLEGSTS